VSTKATFLSEPKHPWRNYRTRNLGGRSHRARPCQNPRFRPRETDRARELSEQSSLALLDARQGAGAAADFQWILDHRGYSMMDPAYPLAELGLARADVLKGDKAGARTAYQNFLAMWKDADATLPVLQQAKAEYARLESSC
jgi:hypothetical protein